MNQIKQMNKMGKMHQAFRVRQRRWNALKPRRHLALEALLGSIGAVVILLLITAGVCASLMRRS
jgi:hypothetical protein